MKLVAIILNYNTPSLTLRAMDSAVDALSVVEGGWKMLVIDNMSTDGSSDIIRERIELRNSKTGGTWQNVEFVQSPVNGGFGAGNNIGFNRYLGTEDEPGFFYILNSDAFPEKLAIKALVDSLENQADCGIAGSYIYGTDDTPHATAFRFPSIFSEIDSSVRLGILSRILKNHRISLGLPEQTRKVDWLAGASMLLRTRVLKEVGTFDESFFLYFEETDLCRRAGMVGWDTIYVVESRVAHVGSASTGMKEKTRIPQYWLNSRRHYFQKNHGKIYYFVATVARILGESIYLLRVLLEGKTKQHPPFYLRDLIKHTFLTTHSASSKEN